MGQWQGIFFWGFLIVFGVVMLVISPKAKSEGSFFKGHDAKGKATSEWLLMISIFISWIFAKSVTNAANLGQTYGIVGGIAYATYWLSIPLAGFVIFYLRRKQGATGLVPFLAQKYGKLAALSFSAAILIRLYNEVWSNTAVVGGYYGSEGSFAYISAALVFTFIVLLYSLKGGLRSSIYTDAIQTLVFMLFLVIVLGFVLPQQNVTRLVTEGEFTLVGGMDLFLVALLQILSYPFHDPVLTDRGFITEEKTMIRAFCLSGILGFIAIVTFSLIGVYAKLEAMPPSGNVPVMVAKSLGILGSFAMLAIMTSSAASTLDSTFASLSKLTVKELPLLAGKTVKRPILIGSLAMIFIALFGNLPMFMGTDILKATTISGTMVIGLAPVFLLSQLVRNSPWSFHLSFWSGILIGLIFAFGWIPQSWAIGKGKQALLLGTNLYGLIICFAGFLIPILIKQLFPQKK